MIFKRIILVSMLAALPLESIAASVRKSAVSGDIPTSVEDLARDLKKDDPKEMEDTLSNVLAEIFVGPNGLLCDGRPRPEVSCGGFSEITESVLRLSFWAACNAQGGFRAGVFDSLADPFEEVVRECSGLPLAPLTPTLVPFPVERFNDGNYDGQVPNPRDIPLFGFEGDENKYGWGQDFNDDLGIGVTIHSAGGLAVVNAKYSLPTFTLRDGDANIIYEGIYGPTPFNTPQQGLRSALVVDRVGNIVTVIAPAAAAPTGEFLRFELDLDEYKKGKPVRGISPTARSPLIASSVRAQFRLTPDVILYAPTFDFAVGEEGPGSNPGFPFLRLYNWRTNTELGIFLTFGDVSFNKDSFVWDFECFKQGGLCWVTTFELFDPNLEVLEFDEETIGRVFTFPVSALDPVPTTNFTIPVVESNLDFTNEFSVISLEPLSPLSSVVCTLSGFLFVLVGIQNGNAGAILTNPETGERRTDDELLRIIELGEPQQCNLCAGSGTDCTRIGFNGQKSTNVYIWAVEECGDKVFAGTNDGSVFLGGIFFGMILSTIASVVCQAPPILAAFGGSSEGCIPFIRDRLLVRTEANGTPTKFQNLLLSTTFDEEITEEDFGFDLFVIDKADLNSFNPVFQPVTLNGFRDLGPNPLNQVDDGVRNMVCHTAEDGSHKLVIASAVFGDGDESSSTFVLDVD